MKGTVVVFAEIKEPAECTALCASGRDKVSHDVTVGSFRTPGRLN
jgi:hypothetical protein